MFDKKTKKKIKDLVHVVNSNFLYKEIQENYKEFIDIGKFLFFPGIIILQKKIKQTEPETKQYLNLTLDEFNKYWSEKKNIKITKTESGVLLQEKKVN